MGLPAFYSPEEGPTAEAGSSVLRLPLDVAERCEVSWQLARAAWTTRPPTGSPEEASAVRLTLVCSFIVLQGFLSRPLEAIREIAHGALRRVVQEELAAAALGRRLALRQLAQAIDHYGTVMEATATGPEWSQWMPEELHAAEAALSAGAYPLGEPLMTLGRATGALLMAFDTMKSDSDDFRGWARLALEEWRAASGGIDQLRNLVRALQTHDDARSAWGDWDDEDRRTELEAWKALR